MALHGRILRGKLCLPLTLKIRKGVDLMAENKLRVAKGLIKEISYNERLTELYGKELVGYDIEMLIESIEGKEIIPLYTTITCYCKNENIVYRDGDYRELGFDKPLDFKTKKETLYVQANNSRATVRFRGKPKIVTGNLGPKLKGEYKIVVLKQPYFMACWDLTEEETIKPLDLKPAFLC